MERPHYNVNRAMTVYNTAAKPAAKVANGNWVNT